MLFGKLPGHGDFVHRGVDDAVRAVWDTWASTGITEAKAELGERFPDAHDRAPPWCFIAGPGALGDRWRVGALAPSTDNAGRRFVFVTALENLTLADAVSLGPHTAEAQIEAIYRIFAERLNADEALDLIASSAQSIGGMSGCALGRLVDARDDGVWWPHIDGFHPDHICGGAVPARDLIPRALNLCLGDPSP
jgi:type VI secretion system protein ImpM